MDWIERVRRGDWVIVEDNVLRGRLMAIVESSGLSITLEDGTRYSRVTGKRMGSLPGDYEYRIVQPTTSRVNEIRRFKLANRLASIRWTHAPLDLLVKVANALDIKPRDGKIPPPADRKPKPPEDRFKPPDDDFKAPRDGFKLPGQEDIPPEDYWPEGDDRKDPNDGDPV